MPEKESVVRIDADGPQQNVTLLIDDGSDIRHDTDIVMSHDAQGDGVLLALALSCPFGAYDAVGNLDFMSLAFGQSQRWILIPPEMLTNPNTSSP